MNWGEIDDNEFPLIIFNLYNSIHKLKFVEYLGSQMKDINGANRKEFAWKVENLVKENEISKLTVISTRLLRSLKNHQPLEGKSFTISKLGRDFNTYYEVSPIMVQSKLEKK